MPFLPNHISAMIFASEDIYLIGFPELSVVEYLTDSVQEFYQQKLKPSCNQFKLYPKVQMKKPKLDDIQITTMAEQFEYEEEANQKQNQEPDKPLLCKNHPLYRLYTPGTVVLRDEYSLLVPEAYKKIKSKEEEALMRDRVKEWANIGYHIHVLQAFKVEQVSGKLAIYIEKLKGTTLRDLIQEGFFMDQNKQLNSKIAMNCLLQIAVGINFIHSRGFVHQELIPDHIFVQKNTFKVGYLCSFSLAMGKICKNFSAGSSPQYWSPQQASIYQAIRFKTTEGGYQSSMKLLPALTSKSDLYQFGLIILQLTFGCRKWVIGNTVNVEEIKKKHTSNLEDSVADFLLGKAEEFLAAKAEERPSLKFFILGLLDLYPRIFDPPENLLWCPYFDQAKYQSDLLNNKAVGLYLSGNQTDCDKAWSSSLQSNPCNLVAQYNYSHFRRMRKFIDDRRVIKELKLIPQSRQRNFYLLASSLVQLPLLKEPFKSFNFNPKLAKAKEVEILSTIISGLESCKKPKNICSVRRQYLHPHRFVQGYVVKDYYLWKVKDSNTFYAFRIGQQIQSYNYIKIECPKLPSPERHEAQSALDFSNSYLAISDNSYLCVHSLKPSIEVATVYFQITDYGSNITTMQFDHKGQLLGIGSTQFEVKIISLLSKQIQKIIHVGNRFKVNNLEYYNQDTCIVFNYEVSVNFYLIGSDKQLFSICCASTVIGYSISEESSVAIMVVLTREKFQIWNLKQKARTRNIQIDQAPQIQGFFANSNKKIVLHYTQQTIRLWNYTTGLVLKSYCSSAPITWVHLDTQARFLYSIDSDSNFFIRYIGFLDFLKGFQKVCLPTELCLRDSNTERDQQMKQYAEKGRQLISNLNQYRLNQQKKRVSLEKMYRIAESIKGSFFYQDKQDIKTIFKYLNSIKQAQDPAAKINSYSEDYIFMSPNSSTTVISNYSKGYWLIGESNGAVRLVSAPDTIHLMTRPRKIAVTHLTLQPTFIFIGYHSHCYLLDRQTQKIKTSHSSYHKKTVRMGTVVNNVLATGDEDELVLFWDKDKVKKYQVPVNMGLAIGNKLLIAAYDNRVRMYGVDSEEGLQKLHVFVGHVMKVYELSVVDDSVFVSYSYDGTVRWWSIQVLSCFSYFNFAKYFPGDNILWVDMPEHTLEEEKYASFEREGYALVLLNSNQVVVFDMMRKEPKWKFQLSQDLTKAFWTDYPHTFAVSTNQEVFIFSVFWKYTSILQ